MKRGRLTKNAHRVAFQQSAKDYATASANFADDPGSAKYENAADLAWAVLESKARAYIIAEYDLVERSAF